MRLLTMVVIVCMSYSNSSSTPKNEVKKDDTLQMVTKKDREEFRRIKLVIDTAR